MLEQPDQNATDQVHDEDDDAGDGVAAHELGGAVHRAVKVGLAADFAAPCACFTFVEKAGVEVGIDRQLLARHRIQGEARRHLGDAPGALGDDDKVDDDQDQEHHEADDVVAADQEIAEGLDHLARRVRPGVALHQDDAGGRDVERQAQQRRQQQHRGEHREIQRAPRVQAHQHHDHRQRDVER